MANETSKLDNAERGVKMIKELTLMCLLGYVGWYMVPFIPKWAASLDGARISEVSLAGISLKLEQTEQKLAKAVAAPTVQKSPSDEAVSSDKKLVVEALETVQSLRAESQGQSTGATTQAPTKFTGAPAPATTGASFWVYLGLATGESIPPRNFRVSRLPAPGAAIEASTDVYKRDSAPVYKGDDWYLGGTIGVVKEGQKVVVRRLEKIPSTQPGTEVVWAEVVGAP
jgi:hypothetical protein